MANNILTPVQITRESARILENELVFNKKINREYSDEFARKGAKIGATINARMPARYTSTTGAALAVQDFVETYIPLTLTTQRHVDIAFTSQELTLNLDDFSTRVLRPAISQLANDMDVDGVSMAKNATFNLYGTPGSIPTSMLPYTTAKAAIYDQGGPKDNGYTAILSPMAEVTLIDGQKGLFQSSEKIAAQYEQGHMGMAGGLNFYMSQVMPIHTVGPLGGTPAVNGDQSASAPTGALTTTTSDLQQPFSLVTDGWTAAAAVRLNAGDVFTIAGVYSVNPQTRQSTGRLQQFVVTSQTSSDGSGNATVPILPRPIFSGQYQNVTSSTNNIANNALLTVVGTASTSYRNNLVFHKDAYMLGTADLIMPDGVDMAARENYKGISMRMVRQYRIGTDDLPARVDILYGHKQLYNALGARVTE